MHGHGGILKYFQNIHCQFSRDFTVQFHHFGSWHNSLRQLEQSPLLKQWSDSYVNHLLSGSDVVSQWQFITGSNLVSFLFLPFCFRGLACHAILNPMLQQKWTRNWLEHDETVARRNLASLLPRGQKLHLCLSMNCQSESSCHFTKTCSLSWWSHVVNNCIRYHQFSQATENNSFY